MDLILWLEKLTGSELVREVSILVLVDLILWLIFSAPAFFISSGFNPCFGGSYIVTIKLQTKVKQDRGFNPCFGGSYIVTGKLHRWLSGGYRFQSLFWWILYCDTKEMKTSCLYGRFNPCFGGSYIVTKPSRTTTRQYWMFQSLFWWILYCDNINRGFSTSFFIVSILVLVDLILWLK